MFVPIFERRKNSLVQQATHDHNFLAMNIFIKAYEKVKNSFTEDASSELEIFQMSQLHQNSWLIKSKN